MVFESKTVFSVRRFRSGTLAQRVQNVFRKISIANRHRGESRDKGEFTAFAFSQHRRAPDNDNDKEQRTHG